MSKEFKTISTNFPTSNVIVYNSHFTMVYLEVSKVYHDPRIQLTRTSWVVRTKDVLIEHDSKFRNKRFQYDSFEKAIKTAIKIDKNLQLELENHESGE